MPTTLHLFLCMYVGSVHVCAYTSAEACIRVWMHVCARGYACACLHLCRCMCEGVNTCMCIWLRMWLCMCMLTLVQMHVRGCKCIYVHVDMHKVRTPVQTCVWACECMYVHMEAPDWYWKSFSITLHFTYWGRVSLWSQGSPVPAGGANQLTSEIPSATECWGYGWPPRQPASFQSVTRWPAYKQVEGKRGLLHGIAQKKKTDTHEPFHNGIFHS